MKRRKIRRRVTAQNIVKTNFNSDNTSGNSSSDAKSQVSLDIGSDAYEEMREDLQQIQQNKEIEEPFHEELEDDNEQLRDEQITKQKIADSFRTPQYKYRRYMSKDVNRKKVQTVIEKGLEKDVPKRDFEDELHDDGISADEFPHEAAVDYKQEYHERLKQRTVDTNQDGKIDHEDEPVVTPELEQLGKYM